MTRNRVQYLKDQVAEPERLLLERAERAARSAEQIADRFQRMGLVTAASLDTPSLDAPATGFSAPRGSIMLDPVCISLYKIN